MFKAPYIALIEARRTCRGCEKTALERASNKMVKIHTSMGAWALAPTTMAFKISFDWLSKLCSGLASYRRSNTWEGDSQLKRWKEKKETYNIFADQTDSEKSTLLGSGVARLLDSASEGRNKVGPFTTRELGNSNTGNGSRSTTTSQSIGTAQSSEQLFNAYPKSRRFEREGGCE